MRLGSMTVALLVGGLVACGSSSSSSSGSTGGGSTSATTGSTGSGGTTGSCLPDGGSCPGTTTASSGSSGTSSGSSGTSGGQVNVIATVVYVEKPSVGAGETQVSGSVSVTRDFNPVPDATVTVNGVTLSYDATNQSYTVPAGVSGVGPGATITVAAATGSYAGTAQFDCPDVAITAPTENTVVGGNQTLSVTWSGTLPAGAGENPQIHCDYSKNGTIAVGGNGHDLSPGDTSTTVDTPATMVYDSSTGALWDYTVGLYAPGALAAQTSGQDLIGGSCKVWRQVTLVAQ